MGQNLSKLNKENVSGRNIHSITHRSNHYRNEKYTDICLRLSLFSSNINYYTKKMNTLRYVTNCKRLSLNNSNAILYKLTSEVGKSKLTTFLKLMVTFETDNSIYEYLVSRRVNYFTNTPNTLCILNLYKLKHEDIHTVMKIKEPAPSQLQNIMERVTGFNEQVVNDSCNNWKLYAFDQLYISDFITFESFLSKQNDIPREHYYETIWHVLMQVYSFLRIYQNIFTHHDLHSENVILVYIPGKVFRFVYEDKNLNCRVEFYSPYLVKIIDYGRSYCQHVTERIYEQICRLCPKCGEFSGYQFRHMPLYLNRSSDLRLLKILKDNFILNDSTLQQLLNIVKFDTHYDTEIMSESGLKYGRIHTVEDAYLLILLHFENNKEKYSRSSHSPYVTFRISTEPLKSMSEVLNNKIRLSTAYKCIY